jgi:hypothetical protein
MCYTRTINGVTSLHLLKPPDFMKANYKVKYVAQAPFMEQVILTFSHLSLQIFVNAHHQFIPPFIVYREIYMETKYKCLLTSLLTKCERGPGWLNELDRYNI